MEAFASSPDRLNDELCNHGLITQAASLISTGSSGGGQAALSTSTYTVIANNDYNKDLHYFTVFVTVEICRAWFAYFQPVHVARI